MTSEELFLWAWRCGVTLAAVGGSIRCRCVDLPPELAAELKEHKRQMLKFLSHWIDTPYGPAKFWGFLDEKRCGVVLKYLPDRVTWIQRNELRIKATLEDEVAVAN